MAAQQLSQQLSLHDLVELIPSRSSDSTSSVLPRSDTYLSALQARYKGELCYTYAGPQDLLVLNPGRVLANLSDDSAAQYERSTGWHNYKGSSNGASRGEGAYGEGEEQGGTAAASRRLQPHPYEHASRIWHSMQRSGKSQAVVYNGLSGSGKSYSFKLITSQLLRLSSTSASVSSSSVKRVLKLSDQIRSAQTLLDAFGSAKSALCPNATRQGRVLELHYSGSSVDENSSILSGAKICTFGFDKSRLVGPLGKEERSFHVFYQFLAGATAAERTTYKLLDDPAEYDLLASSGTYRLGPEQPDDAIAFGELKAAFQSMGFKPKHVEMIHKVLSAILLLGNVTFAPKADDIAQDSVTIAYESIPTFTKVCELLGLPGEELERALVNKTTYVRKEVVCALLDSEGAVKQRDNLMAGLYAILFSYIVESANHRLYPGDDAIRKMQRDNKGTSIVQLDMPGFQTKSPSGGLFDPSSGGRNSRGSTLVQAYGEDGFEQFTLNYQAELLQHWLNKRTFQDDSTDFARRAVQDGVGFPEVDVVDTSAMTLELLRGGVLGSRADTKPGGMLGGLNKTCSNLRKGKIGTEEAADASFMEGMEERFSNHSRFVPRITGRLSSNFAIKHYAGSVAYSSKNFVEKDSDLLDSEFVRLFRTSSSESFLAKLFSGPSLAAESHPRDPSVIVAAQVSSQPLRRLSPLKVSRHASTSVPSDNPEPEIESITAQLNQSLTSVLAALNEIPVWSVTCIRPNDNSLPGVYDIRRVKSQLDAVDLASTVAKRRIEYIEDLEFSEFGKRYAEIAGEGEASAEGMTRDEVQRFLEARGAKKGKDFGLGEGSVWLSFVTWRMLEGSQLSLTHKETETHRRQATIRDATRSLEANSQALQHASSMPTSPVGDDAFGKKGSYESSSEDLLKNVNALPYDSAMGIGRPNAPFMHDGQRSTSHQSTLSLSPSNYFGNMPQGHSSEVWGSEWRNAPANSGGVAAAYNALNGGGSVPASPTAAYANGGAEKSGSSLPGTPGAPGAGGEKEKDKGRAVEEVVPTSFARRAWLALTWTLTWWIPTFALTHLGRMKRPDVRIAWREKVALCILILLVCATLLFTILGLGMILCPDKNKAWNIKELGYHQGRTDYFVGVRGEVYDMTNFYKSQHSDIIGQDVTTDDMMELAGQDLTNYFPVPLTLGCPDLVTDTGISLQYANFTIEVPNAVHLSGPKQPDASSALRRTDWYTSKFMPKMDDYHKGPIVYSKGDLSSGAENDGRIWAMYNKKVYDISDYLYTITQMNGDDNYQFLPSALTDLFQEQSGQDITSAINDISESDMDAQTKQQAFFCLDNVFYRGSADFREDARCTVPDYFLLAFSIILIGTMTAKFIAALQITKKRNPELQDKFVICQVPCYTEGEDSLKKTIDSLANLKYDDKRKLLFVICDGMIVGSGNDRPTPRIVLDILGVENLDPDPLLFKSLGEGSKQLNYGKVYSGLYEFEGHVLPYIVVVKVGKPSERSRPGNRGKRDSQILLMRYLNRVHFDAEMSPLELEINHQIKNVIGVDPTLYEFLLTVDADTEVKPDSLNRLVAVAANDSSIIGLCGETKLSNEQDSWWTMIQVYEYYISHHLAKAFESLFGSVTCLPGCFTIFRLRTADKGRPLLISNLVIDDYSENEVDTLHKKNLLHLGEDRYLTTLILKHFPLFRTKFASDARAMTVAPDKWNILLSQRRRWINSTVHNLFELVAVKDLCGMCCFSMRFVVFIDLLGTIMLPATSVYLVYLIVSLATTKGAIPTISLIMIAASYGFQVVIFLLKRQWQFIGWLVIYLLAFPIYSFFLPLYSFWHFDDFSWGNTRVVVGEGKNKKVLATDDDHFDESMIPLRKFSEYQQQAWTSQKQMMVPSGHSPQPSEAGFSLAPPKMQGHSPHGSFGGGNMGDFISRPASRAHTLMNYPNGGLQPAFSPFAHHGGGGYIASQDGSVVGSDHGGINGGGLYNANLPPFAHQSHMSMSQFGGMGAPSMLGMPHQPFASAPGSMAARNSTYSLGQWGGGPMHGSSYSLASNTNPFSDPAHLQQQMAQQQQQQPAHAADPANPTDAEIVVALREYLKMQDLLQVTKRSTREAMAQKFPEADLADRKQFLNKTIDAILQGQL